MQGKRALCFWLLLGACSSNQIGQSQDNIDGGLVAPLPDATALPDIVDPPFTGTTGTLLFVTQVPTAEFNSVVSVFGNHQGSLEAVPRGGDLMIRYPDGALRNLTREAGFGSSGMQGEKAIAVREPAVHWSGNKAVFAMVVGAPTKQYQVANYNWQLYEVTGLAKGQTATVTRVVNQPEGWNNVAPSYAPDDTILFTTDRPRGGEAHLAPQLDEYESAPTVSGLWKLDPTTGNLQILSHAPSGVFSPSVDSSGRAVFIKWDHLQRDQQADADRDAPTYGSFTYADESAGAAKNASLAGMELFPEPRDDNDPDRAARVSLHTFNQFMPWMINLDGTGEETLNHVGRHELGGTYTEGSFTDDPNLTYDTQSSPHKNAFYIRGDGGYLHLREDPTMAGRFYATYAHEFGTASGGALVRFDAPPGMNPEDLVVTPLVHPDAENASNDPADAPKSTGHYRNPLALGDGTLIASHTPETVAIKRGGTTAAPQWSYSFRLRVLRPDGGGTYLKAVEPLTAGIKGDVTWWSPDVLITWKGDLWELDAVEVRPRPRPAPAAEPIEAPEQAVLDAEGVSADKLRAWLRNNDLALIISRNVTQRDRADRQQPFNLRVPGGAQTVGAAGKIYDVPYFQIFQGDALRGYGGVNQPRAGRRLLARPMHGAGISPKASGAPTGAVAVAPDGSMAAFVPARRALTWQLTDGGGQGVVRERNWVTFAAGEIRTCAVCHGLNRMNQAGGGVPVNQPEALRQLIREWKKQNP